MYHRRETSGVKGRRGCLIIRVQGKDSRAYRMVPLRINDAFRGRSIEGPDSAQWNDIAVIIRDSSHPPIALIPTKSKHSLFVLLTHTRWVPYIFPCSKYRSFQASYFLRLLK